MEKQRAYIHSYWLTLAILLVPSIVGATPPTRTYTYVAGEVIASSEVTTNEDNLYNYLQAGVDRYAPLSIDNADISASANIQSDKLNLQSIAQAVGITSGGSFDNNGTTTLDGTVSITAALSATGTSTFSNVDINDGTLDGVDVGNIESGIGSFTTLTGINITATNTLKLGTTNQGDILYDNGTSLVRLTPGTDGQFLKTQGAGANPTWADNPQLSNVVFSWGAAGDFSSGDYGFFYGDDGGASITPGATIGSGQGDDKIFYGSEDSTYRTFYRTKFNKLPQQLTVTVYCYVLTGGTSGDVQADIGGQTGTDNFTDVAWAWTSFTVDVSGLTNGTIYDVTLKIKNNGANSSAVSAVIGLAS